MAGFNYRCAVADLVCQRRDHELSCLSTRCAVEHLVDRETVMMIPTGSSFADPAQIRAKAGAPVEAINWHMMGSRAVAEVTTANGIKTFRCPNRRAHTAGRCRSSNGHRECRVEVSREAGFQSIARHDRKPLNTGLRYLHGVSLIPIPMPRACLLPSIPAKSPLFAPARGGFMISSGASTSWTGRTTRISTHGGCWHSPSEAWSWALLVRFYIFIRWPLRRKRKAKRIALS